MAIVGTLVGVGVVAGAAFLACKMRPTKPAPLAAAGSEKAMAAGEFEASAAKKEATQVAEAEVTEAEMT